MKDFDRRLRIIFVIQVTEVLGFSLILPFLPFYAQEYGATPLTIGLILTVFSLFQFISAPIMGTLSDTYGRRPLLIFSQLSTLVGFVVLGFAHNLWMIFLSRIIDGLLGSNMTIAQAYISDISTPANRSKAFNINSVAFGVGLLVGPAIGGWLSQFGYAVPSLIAAAVTLISIGLTYAFLPETVERRAGTIKWQKLQFINVPQIQSYFRNPQLNSFLWQFFLFSLAHVIWTSNFAIYGDRKLALTASSIGFLLAYVGLLSIILRGFVIPQLLDRFEERKLLMIGKAFIIIGLISPIFMTTLQQFLGTITLLSLGIGIGRPTLMGAISRAVSSREQGAVMGVSNSLGTLAQVIGPVAGGWLLTTAAPDSVMVVSAAIMIWGLVLLIRSPRAELPTTSS